MQADLQQASCQASRLAQENDVLKLRGLPPEVDPALADPVAAQQVARQMEALLQEKSKLVAENDRLLRENTGLQVRMLCPRLKGAGELPQWNSASSGSDTPEVGAGNGQCESAEPSGQH